MTSELIGFDHTHRSIVKEVAISYGSRAAVVDIDCSLSKPARRGMEGGGVNHVNAKGNDNLIYWGLPFALYIVLYLFSRQAKTNQAEVQLGLQACGVYASLLRTLGASPVCCLGNI